MSKIFLDSNVVVYAFTNDARSAVAERLLTEEPELSVQVLNEFANVARKKLRFDWSQIEEALKAIRLLAGAIHPIDLRSHESAIAIAQRYGFSIYDALIIASAQIAHCEVLYSEDLQDGQTIEGVSIKNPFSA